MDKKSSILIKLNKNDKIPQGFTMTEKSNFISTKMWECELKGNHLKAEYWRRKLMKVKGTAEEQKLKQLEKLHEKEYADLQIQFDGKCKAVVDCYTKELESLNHDSIELVDRLKKHQLEDRNVLKFALKKSYGHAKINKRILDLRKIEYCLGRNEKFIEAQRVKEEIGKLQLAKAQKHLRQQFEKDREATEKLAAEHKKEMKTLLDKLAVKKGKVYRKLQTELIKLETWKEIHDQRLDSSHKKDKLKLQKKLLAQAPPSQEKRIDKILKEPPPKARNQVLRTHARSSSIYSNASNLQFLEESKKAMKIEDARLSMIHDEKIDQLDLRKSMNINMSGTFVQHVNGETHKVIVEIDEISNEVRWKRKQSKCDMIISCRIKFDDIINIETEDNIEFAPNQKNNCFAIVSKSITLNLEARSHAHMMDVTKKLQDAILNL